MWRYKLPHMYTSCSHNSNNYAACVKITYYIMENSADYLTFLVGLCMYIIMIGFNMFRTKELKASSVAELCDLSHYDDIRSYANTTSALNTKESTSSLSNSVRSHPLPANPTTTTDAAQQGIQTGDLHSSSQSCPASGQRQLMKQVSISSIQVSEGTVYYVLCS